MALRTDKKGRSIGGAVSPALKAGEVYVLFLIETKKKKKLQFDQPKEMARKPYPH
jgi:hypothetical protein